MARDPVRDVVRGLTSLEMTFVNASGLPWTAHSDYIGQITYADTIFPCFAFLAGMSPAPTRRNVGLIGLGVSLNAVNSVLSGKHLRLPGVLQRLGLAGLIANEPHLEFLRRWHGTPLIFLWYAVILLGASGPVVNNPLAHPGYPAADSSMIAQSRIDRLAFGHRLHTPLYDPEGLLGALTTAVSMIIGRSFVAVNLPASHKVVAAASMVVTGEALHFLLPKYASISKSLWTPSFVLVTSGFSVLKFIAIEQLLPYLPAVIQETLQAVGRRSLEAYVISSALGIYLYKIGGDRSLLKQAIRMLGRVTGPSAADFIINLGFTGLVAISCKVLVNQNLRLRW